ncbi:DUF6402 family protein [Thauera sinica]|uniref:DUF6402 family protein n=1 Tax=Thauera sinica TaxID=2665146 RepID=A0ABW1AQD1_9RHOO|nr:DUF6402 family protein [Thauera sp. K11]
MPFYINEIPDVMKGMGWNIAAALMFQWFSNPVYKMPIEMRSGKKERPLPPEELQRNHEEVVKSIRKYEEDKRKYKKEIEIAERIASEREKNRKSIDDLDMWEPNRSVYYGEERTVAEDLVELDPMELTPDQYNDSIVSMQWYLGFPRARDILFNGKVIGISELRGAWATENGVKLLVRRLMKAGWKPNQKLSFSLGSINMGARQLDSICQVNRADHSDNRLVVDELLGALGTCTIKIAVVGSTSWLPFMGNFFNVKKIGIYLRDTYDFNGLHEVLGLWDKSKCYSFGEVPWKSILDSYSMGAQILFGDGKTRSNVLTGNAVLVTNAEFRRWQDVKQQGGDFVVYSKDVLWVDPPKGGERIYLPA